MKPSLDEQKQDNVEGYNKIAYGIVESFVAQHQDAIRGDV